MTADLSLAPGATAESAAQADALLARLFPLCRSLTGDAVRESLRVLAQTAHFDIKEIPSGTVCYDWTVPNEWNIRDAYIADASGARVVDFAANNIHVVGYSVPVEKQMHFSELRAHLHSLPDLPNAIPYRTSYYHRNWGFCLSEEQLSKMDRDAEYTVKIDASLRPGSMSYGERLLPGTSGEEYLLWTYCCHPSLANDNLSGPVLWALLLRALEGRKLRHSYRFAIGAETIGAIAYLAANETAMQRLAGGFVITTVAGPGGFGYKATFQSDHLIDRIVRRVFAERGLEHKAYPFDVWGSDESHFSAPFFRIPVGTISKDKYYEYPYYHTSLDNLDFVSGAALASTLELYLEAIEMLEANQVYRSLVPQCEPMLSQRGLYPKVGGHVKQPAAGGRGEDGSSPSPQRELDALMWLMFYGDGRTSLHEIAERTNLPMAALARSAASLCEHGLLEPVSPGS